MKQDRYYSLGFSTPSLKILNDKFYVTKDYEVRTYPMKVGELISTIEKYKDVSVDMLVISTNNKNLSFENIQQTLEDAQSLVYKRGKKFEFGTFNNVSKMGQAASVVNWLNGKLEYSEQMGT